MRLAAVLIASLFVALLIAACTKNERSSGKENMAQVQELEALSAIKKSYSSEEQEYGVTLFVGHHLEELDSEYWKELTGTEKPTPQQVLDKLKLMNKWKDEGQTNFDFSLPGEVTQYVICVSFSENGHIQEISMES